MYLIKFKFTFLFNNPTQSIFLNQTWDLTSSRSKLAPSLFSGFFTSNCTYYANPLVYSLVLAIKKFKPFLKDLSHQKKQILLLEYSDRNFLSIQTISSGFGDKMEELQTTFQN